MSINNNAIKDTNNNKIKLKKYIEEQIKTRLEEIRRQSENSNQDIEYLNITNEFKNNINKSKELYMQLTDILSTVNNLEFQKYILEEINNYNSLNITYESLNYSVIFKYIIKKIFTNVPISINKNNENKNKKLLLNNNSEVNYKQFSPNQMKAILKSLNSPPLFYNYKSNYNSLKLKTNNIGDFIENLLELYKYAIQIDINIDNLFSKIKNNNFKITCPNSSNINKNIINKTNSRSLIKGIEKTNKIITKYYKDKFKQNICK